MYLEVFGPAVPGLRLRRDFLPGVLLPAAATGRLPPPARADDVDAGEGDRRLACFCSAPPTSGLFFTQVNWEVLKKALQEGGFDDLGNGAAGGGATPAEVDGVTAFSASPAVLLMSKALACGCWELVDVGAAPGAFFCFSFSPGEHF